MYHYYQYNREREKLEMVIDIGLRASLDWLMNNLFELIY